MDDPRWLQYQLERVPDGCLEKKASQLSFSEWVMLKDRLKVWNQWYTDNANLTSSKTNPFSYNNLSYVEVEFYQAQGTIPKFEQMIASQKILNSERHN